MEYRIGNGQGIMLAGGMTRRNVLAGLGAATALAGIGARRAFAQDKPLKIGFLSDFSGFASAISGQGGYISAQLAVEDAKSMNLGGPVELLQADHRSKADTALAIAREWYDQGVEAIFDIGASSIAFGMQDLAREKNKVAIFTSTSNSDLTGKHCSPNGLAWNFDSRTIVYPVVDAIAQEKKKWFFIAIDYAYGVAMQADATTAITAAGGEVVGGLKFPLDASEFSSYILQAQGSGADVVCFVGIGTQNTAFIKQATEFGLRSSGQTIVPIGMIMTDFKAIGLELAQGLHGVESFYWDQNDKTRAFAKRHFDISGAMPHCNQAVPYSAVTHYLKAVEALGGASDALAVIAKMRELPVNDFMTKDKHVRDDGRLVRDMYIFRVKSPADSTGEWDIYEQVAQAPSDKSFSPADPAVCPLVKA